MQQQVKTALGTIIILIFAVTAGYFIWQYEKIQPEVAQPTQVNIYKAADETVGWQTYTNTQYGFSLKYPKNLDYDEQVPSKDVMETEIIDDGAGHNVFNLLIAKNAKAQIVNSGISLSIAKRENNNPAFPEIVLGLISRQEVSIDNQKAVKYIYRGTAFTDGGEEISDIINAQYVVEKAGYIYSINSYGADSTFYNTIDRLASTLKFID